MSGSSLVILCLVHLKLLRRRALVKGDFRPSFKSIAAYAMGQILQQKLLERFLCAATLQGLFLRLKLVRHQPYLPKGSQQTTMRAGRMVPWLSLPH